MLCDFVYMACEMAVCNDRKQVRVTGGQRRADPEGLLGTAAATAVFCLDWAGVSGTSISQLYTGHRCVITP